MSQTIDVSDAVAPVKKSQRWQFSVRSLLILMSLCCAFLTCCVVPPIGAIAMMIMAACLAVFCVVAAFYGRGWIRPFGIVCGISMVPSFVAFMSSHIHSAGEATLVMLMLAAICMATGLLAATVHGLLKKRFGIVPIPNVPFLRDCLYNPEPEEIVIK